MIIIINTNGNYLFIYNSLWAPFYNFASQALNFRVQGAIY